MRSPSTVHGNMHATGASRVEAGASVRKKIRANAMLLREGRSFTERFRSGRRAVGGEVRGDTTSRACAGSAGQGSRMNNRRPLTASGRRRRMDEGFSSPGAKGRYTRQLRVSTRTVAGIGSLALTIIAVAATWTQARRRT